MIEKKVTFKNATTCVSEKNIFLSPFKNFI